MFVIIKFFNNMIRNLLITICLIFFLQNILQAQIDFKQPIEINIGSEVGSISTGDVNNDGLTDIVAATMCTSDPDHDYSIVVILQQQNGTYQPPVYYPYPPYFSSIAVVKVADVNNDGLNDVIFTNRDSLGIRYQLASGILGNLHSFYSGISTSGLGTGDLNNDGLLDIAICHGYSNYITIFYQQTSGTLVRSTISLGYSCKNELNIADMNGDGLDDVIFLPGLESGLTVAILFQDSSTGLSSSPVGYTYQSPNWSFPEFSGFGTGDLNNDGRIDLVGSVGGNNVTASIAIVYQTQNGTMDTAIFLHSYDIPTPVEISDLNCDSKQEIIVGHYASGDFSVWEQDETGNYSGYKLFERLGYVNPYCLNIGDINNDSRPDVISTTGDMYLEFMLNHSIQNGVVPLDTIIVYDLYQLDTTRVTENVLEKVDTCRFGECLVQTDSMFMIYTYSLREQIIGDSIFPLNFNMCGVEQADTNVFHFETINHYYLYEYDTVWIMFDTLVENRVVINQWENYDTTCINQLPLTYPLVISHTLYTQDSIFITTDSLLISKLYLEIYYTYTSHKVEQGLRCGIIVIDTIIYSFYGYDFLLLSSDTTLISQTTVGYPLGIDEPDISKSIRLYPNPTSDNCALEFDNTAGDNGPLEISMIDQAGRVAWKKEYPLTEKFHTAIERGSLPAGIYTLRLEGRKFFGIIKVVFTP
jgi:hypothetical protein